MDGYEINSKESDGLGTTISNFARCDKPEVNNGVLYQSMGGSNSTTRIVSYITRANYDYDQKFPQRFSLANRELPSVLQLAPR